MKSSFVSGDIGYWRVPDNGDPFRRDLTIRWWEHEMPDYRVVSFTAGAV